MRGITTIASLPTAAGQAAHLAPEVGEAPTPARRGRRVLPIKYSDVPIRGNVGFAMGGLCNAEGDAC